MEDNQFFDAVTAAIEAAQNFLDTDRAYGPDNPRTRDKKDRLAQTMQTLTPTNVDIPELRVIHGGTEERLERGYWPPSPDPQRWSQVRAHLVQELELPAEWIDTLHERGRIYADRGGDPVFLGEDQQPFLARLPGEDTGSAPVLIIAESPVEALSALEMHRRLNRDRPDGRNERGDAVAISAEGPLPHQAIQAALDRGGVVRVATGNNTAGEAVWQEIREQYPSQQLERAKPMMEDWNETLRFNNACYRDPAAAARQLDELQRQNPPGAQSRAAVRDAVRRLGPARSHDRDPYER